MSRLARGVLWLGPLTTLVLLPKCPACLAGYVLLLTGIPLACRDAASLRWPIMVGCLVLLGALATRAIWRRI